MLSVQFGAQQCFAAGDSVVLLFQLFQHGNKGIGQKRSAIGVGVASVPVNVRDVGENFVSLEKSDVCVFGACALDHLDAPSVSFRVKIVGCSPERGDGQNGAVSVDCVQSLIEARNFLFVIVLRAVIIIGAQHNQHKIGIKAGNGCQGLSLVGISADGLIEDGIARSSLHGVYVGRTGHKRAVALGKGVSQDEELFARLLCGLIGAVDGDVTDLKSAIGGEVYGKELLARGQSELLRVGSIAGKMLNGNSHSVAIYVQCAVVGPSITDAATKGKLGSIGLELHAHAAAEVRAHIPAAIGCLKVIELLVCKMEAGEIPSVLFKKTSTLDLLF